jgi:perosamine synthetase
MKRNHIKATIVAIAMRASGNVRNAMEAIDRGALGVAILNDENGRFLGLVTDGDIRRTLLGGKGLETPILEIANLHPLSARVGDAPAKVATMLSERSRFIPVLDEADRVVDLAYFDKRSHLPMADPTFGEKELSYVTECILSGWISSAGKFVTRFEDVFAEYCGTRYAVSVCNGTCALHLALLALDLEPGDEVIVPSLSFIATANAVRYTGARPVFVDSEPRTWNIDPARIEAVITPRTRAIMPVHLYGHPADMDTILEIASRHKLAVIEDAAEAHGALYKGKKVGGIGELGCFSFYGNKIITTGEGGMIVTNRKDLADKMRILRDHGMSPERRYWHPVLGYNYRLTNIQAAIGVAQMEKIDFLLAQKRAIAAAYASSIAQIAGLSAPVEEPWARGVYWLNSFLVDEAKFGMSRDTLMSQLKAKAIETRPVFPCIHKQPIYENGESLPVAEHLSNHGLSLPSAANLTLGEVDRVVAMLREVSSSAGKSGNA